MLKSNPLTPILLCLAISPVVASPSSAAAGPEEEQTSNQFVITPRVWFGNFSPPQSSDFRIQEKVLIPMYGATLSFTPKQMPRFSLIATGLYGTGDGRVADSNAGQGTEDLTRTDAEILGRYVVSESKVYLLGGFRYIKLDTETKFPDSNNNLHEDNTNKIGFIELGAGFSHDVTQDGRHRVFGNVVGLLGRSKNDFHDSIGPQDNESTSTPAYGVDVNIGYQYQFAPSWSAAVRYRSVIYSFTNTAEHQTFKDSAAFHGLELGVSFQF